MAGIKTVRLKDYAIQRGARTHLATLVKDYSWPAIYKHCEDDMKGVKRYYVKHDADDWRDVIEYYMVPPGKWIFFEKTT